MCTCAAQNPPLNNDPSSPWMEERRGFNEQSYREEGDRLDLPYAPD
jgi:hypothetical protein